MAGSLAIFITFLMFSCIMKAVIFDLDDTLIDFVERKNLVIKESVKAMIDSGLDEDYDSLLEDFSNFYWKQIEDQKIFQKYLMKKYGKIDYKVLAHAILAYRKTNSGLLRPYPGAKKLLIELKQKGFKLAILSDAPKLEAYIRLCSVGFEDFFDVILTGDDVPSLKPSKKAFLMAAKKLKLDPKECFMVGDRPKKDVEGAKGLGMKTILVRYNHSEKVGTKADYEVNSIKELFSTIISNT